MWLGLEVSRKRMLALHQLNLRSPRASCLLRSQRVNDRSRWALRAIGAFSNACDGDNAPFITLPPSNMPSPYTQGPHYQGFV